MDIEVDKILTGTFEFKNIGRSNSSFKKDLSGEISLWKAIRPYLLSEDLDWTYDAEENKGCIFAGMRLVGMFKKLDP